MILSQQREGVDCSYTKFGRNLIIKKNLVNYFDFKGNYSIILVKIHMVKFVLDMKVLWKLKTKGTIFRDILEGFVLFGKFYPLLRIYLNALILIFMFKL